MGELGDDFKKKWDDMEKNPVPGGIAGAPFGLPVDLMKLLQDAVPPLLKKLTDDALINGLQKLDEAFDVDVHIKSRARPSQESELARFKVMQETMFKQRELDSKERAITKADEIMEMVKALQPKEQQVRKPDEQPAPQA